MGNQVVSGMVTVLMAIIGVAIIAALVSNKAQTSQVIGAAASGFGQDLGVALSPVTGSTTNFSNSSFTGGGAGTISFA
jgi:hypothetical protein